MNKGIIFNKYGSIADLEYTELPEPQSPEPENAIVKVNAMGLNPRDISVIEGKFKFLTGSKFPKLTGADFSGEVVELPENAKGFGVGDKVFGYFEKLKGGVSSTFCSIPLKYLVRKPTEIKDTEAAALGCTYLTAYSALIEKANIKQGEKVLIYGASGGVGTAALQIAKKLGAIVTAVSNSRNKEYCLSQGADHFVAYDKQNVFELNEKFNLFFQVYSDNGSLYSKGKNITRKDGLYVGLIPNPLVGILGRFNKPKSDFVLVKSNRAYLEEISERVSSGSLTPHIHQVYQLDDFKQAFSDLKNGKIQGKIIITMNG